MAGRMGRLALPLVLMGVALLYVVEALGTRSPYSDESIGVAFFPLVAAATLIVGLVWVILQTLRRPPETVAEAARASWLPPVLVVVATAVYVALFQPLGYFPATFAYVVALLVIFTGGPRRPLRLGVVAALVTLAFWIFFEKLFRVRLPDTLGIM